MAYIHPLPPRTETLERETDFICDICTEPTPGSKKFKNKSHCTHPFCQDCIAKYTEIKIRDDETARIQCPSLDCEKLLDPVSCMEIINPRVFSKWCDLLFEDSLLGLEKSFCPNKDCMALVVNECRRRNSSIREEKKVKCPKCKQLFCFQCKLAWHAGCYDCEENNKNLRDPNDILHGKLAKKMRPTVFPGFGHRVNVNSQNLSHTMNCRCNTRFFYDCGEDFYEFATESLFFVLLALLLWFFVI